METFRYDKLLKYFTELRLIQEDLTRLREIYKNPSELVKVRVNMTFMEKKSKKSKIELSAPTTLRYFIGHLERREKAVKGDIDRMLNRRWYEFWKILW